MGGSSDIFAVFIRIPVRVTERYLASVFCSYLKLYLSPNSDTIYIF